MLSLEYHLRIIKFIFALYLFATWCSMAGMEFFGWLTFLAVTTYLLRAKNDSPLQTQTIKTFLKLYPYPIFLALLAIVAAGLAFNSAEGTDWLFALGTQRYFLILLSSGVALTLFPPTLKGYKIFLIFTLGVAVYAVFQSITGIDLMRLGSERAVQPLGSPGSSLKIWRSAGFFGSPMQYAYIVGMHSCFPLSYILLHRKKVNETNSSLMKLSNAAFVIIFLSLLTTFTRGAWLAAAVAYTFMIIIADRRKGAIVTSAFASLILILFSIVPVLKDRVISVFDVNYSSNVDRVFIWKMNWEMFKDYPLLGIGYHQNEVRGAEYAAKLGQPDAFIGHAHNNYLQMLAGTGMLGLIVYLLMIGYFFWLNWTVYRKLDGKLLWPRTLALACLGAQVYLHVGGLTECNFKAGATNHNFMIVWAIVLTLAAYLNMNRTMSPGALQ